MRDSLVLLSVSFVGFGCRFRLSVSVVGFSLSVSVVSVVDCRWPLLRLSVSVALASVVGVGGLSLLQSSARPVG